MCQVSVIVITFNPDKKKLIRTLSSIIDQENISFEIIICDDGSSVFCEEQIKEYFTSNNFEQYQIVQNSKNQGTVKNCISGLLHAKGEFVFLTSPGDMLFDNNTLKDFYDFAITNDIEICFGNTVFYSVIENEPYLTRKIAVTQNPEIYSKNTAVSTIKKSFFTGNWIVGASYFRKRETAITYFMMVAPFSKYIEDNTSTAFALLDKSIYPIYFNRNIVWYEDGTGVSTGNNEMWNSKLHIDMKLSFSELKRRYPNDNCADYMHISSKVNNRFLRKVVLILKHPRLAFIAAQRKVGRRKTFVQCSDEDLSLLQSLVEGEKSANS